MMIMRGSLSGDPLFCFSETLKLLRKIDIILYHIGYMLDKHNISLIIKRG